MGKGKLRVTGEPGNRPAFKKGKEMLCCIISAVIVLGSTLFTMLHFIVLRQMLI